MASYREIVYLVLDEVKALNNDSTITEEHVIFLANHYRLFLLDLKKLKFGVLALSSANKQTICINLELVNAIPELEYCNTLYLKSKELIPDTLDDSNLRVYPTDYFLYNITFISKERFKFTGYNKYSLNIIYCTLGADNHLYFKSNNPLYLYLKQVKATGIFEDSLKVLELTCNNNLICDILDLLFPLESDLIPSMIELIVKELYGAAWRLSDDLNNSADDLSNLIAYLKKNVKSNLAKLLSE